MRGIKVISSRYCFLSLNSLGPYIAGRREYIAWMISFDHGAVLI
jgi:hypothetical protein